MVFQMKKVVLITTLICWILICVQKISSMLKTSGVSFLNLAKNIRIFVHFCLSWTGRDFHERKNSPIMKNAGYFVF